jgi:hypothetical protein
MAKNASSPGKRFMKLAGMTASIATKTVSNSIRNLTADEEQNWLQKQNYFKISGFKLQTPWEK